MKNLIKGKVEEFTKPKAQEGELEGEVERKMRELVDEVFGKYNPGRKIVNDEGKPYLEKEQMREFIKDIMTACGETECWSDDDFDTSYGEFDKDGSGQVDEDEFKAFVKRFADL